MRELFIERLSWPEIEAAIRDGMTAAVICAASTEQHGPRLPEATDALLGAAYAEGLARRLGDALVAPVLRPACSEHHTAFSGSLTIPPYLLMTCSTTTSAHCAGTGSSGSCSCPAMVATIQCWSAGRPSGRTPTRQ
ncbi:MAG: creatininase family protein [Candidatus Dormibacteraeota bacterium]|uniref:Creatininase family protein n=1 Tax=Candidatus Dormiibacter inghamiae TaxID=3127013 RepID=A0A934ND42_9BACT|nr:creatininase family protein [Candidatus Dormibacteraeota bacterium]MBJ7606003.1 creatininase family protein [Candidatus Dormibacteraeota bacterium]